MKVALVHDWLNTKFGGAENVLVQLAAMYPEAPIYTLLYNRELCGDRIDPARVRPSMLQHAPGWLRRRSRYLLPLIPMAIEQFDLSDYDVVISSSTAWSKGVITGIDTTHICYCHTPMRFVWDYWPQYLDEQRVGPLRRLAIRRLTSRLRLWDYYSAARVDYWVANSQTTAERIRKYYHQTANAVVYPGVELQRFQPASHHAGGNHPEDGYFMTLASLTPYKKIDLAIAACNQLGRRLVVVGEGSDRARLQRLAGPTIEFVGRVSDQRRAELLAGATALIFPNIEDFGIAPIEAMASGTPVVAQRGGGLAETIIDGVTGRFFDQPTVPSLTQVLQNFTRADFTTSKLTAQASHFSGERFEQRLRAAVEQAIHERT